jgi:universal stress protein A
MATFNKILVPIDFEQDSDEAVRVAGALARDNGASVVLVHAYDANGEARVNGYVTHTSEERNRIAADLQRFVDARRHLLQEAGVRQVETRLLNGTPSAEIPRIARQGKFDLIVMGTHGRTGIWLKLLGSVAQTVLGQVPCAVLTVRCPDAALSEQSTQDRREPSGLASAEPDPR